MALATNSETSSFLLLLLLLGNVASGTVFTIENRCNNTIWPGTLSGNGAALLGDGGFSLPPGSSVQFTAPSGWSGRFWGRTGCNFDSAGNGKCVTGDCAGGLKCNGGGAPPVTLAEFTIGSGSGGKDFYDVSLVDGYNVGMGVRATGGTGDCQYAGCVADLNGHCPAELQVTEEGGSVVACKSVCAAFNTAGFAVPAITRLHRVAVRRSTRRCSRLRAPPRIVTLTMTLPALAPVLAPITISRFVQQTVPFSLVIQQYC